MKNTNYEPLVFEGSKCTLKRSIEKNIIGIFESYCYNEIDLPISGTDNLSIRDDLKTLVAKQLSTTLKDCVLPERLYCGGNVYKNCSYMGCDCGEISLLGIELAGEAGPKADAEVISIMINSLLGIGMTEFTICLSNAGFIGGIAKDLSLNVLELKSLISENNTQKLENYLGKNNIGADYKKLILSIPTLFGDLNIYDEINMDILGEESKNALSNIKRIYKLLCEYDMEKYISVDLGIADFEEYYTGMIFKGTVNKTEDFAVCAGGRCNSLAKDFGRNIPLVGGYLEISKITELIYSDSDTDSKLIPLAVVASDIPKLAYKVSFGLRAQGLKVEDYVSGASMIDAIEYGEEKGITIVIWVNEETAIMRNLKTGEMSETSLDKLLNN
ncbi:MAG: ATP phosphoribosyltransferase regulatory subunit [Clostridia bacterium]|nr:ATP phosphoribosyltransferase regulatory subunit [Clostridia bacterium]